ncbi:AAA family ATPase [Pseudonocardia spinosispora]|uniref:AAA family ATPase n=1 Tax=Pseudonocardia spinosispora TaxID=103441 RepID=UPI000401E440|nr:AAA family ATPase [Pseudonocardia spinosispora]
MQELAAESGIDSRTVAQWLYRIDNGEGLAGVDVLVLDEANLTDDRARAALYQAGRASGTKIVEIGDPKQLRSVGCGSMFGYIHAALEGPTLVENRRQRSEDERAALAAYRAGRYSEALSSYAVGGQVVATHTSDEGVAAMVAAWMHAAKGAPDAHTRADGLLMLAKTNEQVTRINEAVQAVREAEGQLGDGRTFALPGGRQVTFRVGDQAILRRNDRTAQAVQGEGVLNGYRAIVTGVEEAGVRSSGTSPAMHRDRRRTPRCAPRSTSPTPGCSSATP